jgi:hypothetical protein
VHRVTHRDGFIYNLQEAIRLEITKAKQIKIKNTLPSGKKQATEEGKGLAPKIELKAISHIIRYGNRDSHIKTEAFKIQVPLKIQLTRSGNKNLVPNRRLAPYGLVQTVGAEVYKKMLRMYNDFLTSFWMIPVFRITSQALKHVKLFFSD